MADTPVCYIYKYTNITNGKVYIGQTWNKLEDRAGSNGCRYKTSEYFYNAIKKYGWDYFSVEILISCYDQKSADEMESFYIKESDSCNLDKGYNLKDGGSHGKHSDITKKKMSEIKLNLSDEAKQNMSNAHKGVPLSKEHAENIGKANKGRIFSQETRNKISESQIGKTIPNEIREKISQTLTGRKQSEETKQKRNKSLTGRMNMKKRKITNEQATIILDDPRSNRKIAKDYDVSPDTINRIKNGKRK